jgi:hypothetical protein
MTRDDIIRLAQEAGMPKVYSFRSSATHWDFHPALEKFAALVATAEREACADICDQHSTCEGIAQKCATAIRARGEP